MFQTSFGLSMAHHHLPTTCYELLSVEELNKKDRLKILLSRLYFTLAGLMILSLSLVNVCFAQADTNTTRYITGKVYNTDSNLLYTEHYSINHDETLVIYKSKQGEILAAKSIAYQSHKPYRPDITIYKHSDNLTLTLSDQNNVLKLTQIDQHNNEKLIRSHNINNQLVTDEAFNRYIQDNWHTIQTNDTTTIDFAIAQHARIMSIDISISHDTTCTELGYQCLSLSPSHWFLSLFVNDVVIGYNQHLNMRYFYGPANSITNTDKQRVSIYYQESRHHSQTDNTVSSLSLHH